MQLDDDEYSPRGSTSLRILGRMERTMWIPSFNLPDITPRRLCLDHGHQRLEIVKKGDHCWLETDVYYYKQAKLSMLTVNANASPLMRWHERLGHLGVAPIKHVRDNNGVTGMSIPPKLFKDKFTCLSCLSAKHKRISYKASAAEKWTKVNYERLMSEICDMGKYLPGLKKLSTFPAGIG